LAGHFFSTSGPEGVGGTICKVDGLMELPDFGVSSSQRVEYIWVVVIRDFGGVSG